LWNRRQRNFAVSPRLIKRIAISYKQLPSNEAFASKVSAELDGIAVFILGKDALIRNKRAVGRPQDLADLDTLES